MNKEKIEQINRLTPKIQISIPCTGRKMLLRRLQSPITFFFVLLSLSFVPTRGLYMGFMKDHPLNLERGTVLTCPYNNMITEEGNESEISSNTVKITIITQVIYSGNSLKMPNYCPF